MPDFSNQVISLFQYKRQAQEQGGLLSGKDPSEVNTTDPIRLWIIQVGIIVATASLLSLGLKRMRQPKVIAEVLGGIILGPTAFGRIPGFTQHIFPQDSRPYLSLVANIGLCLFLFLVGLEIESSTIKRNARLSAMVALAGMILPFGLGAGLAVPIYKHFVDPSIEFTHFMLFVGVAFSITAFPVLCRILTELKLLDTTVGIVVLSAGVGNDIIGWVLLALSVALVNAGSGLTALYILLACVGWTLFLLFPIRWGLRWVAIKTGSIESGPTMFFMTITILILFGSAFFTDVIGVHAIFGAFVTGIIVPREGGLAISLTEKLEDMVSIIFLPLYFTLSGLSTDLGLLNNGIIWAFTIAIIILAFIGKFGGCTIAAHYAAGFSWRESSTIGSLMSCKGLVELIVLNVGLQAKILSPTVFSMFVLEALTLTFITTPLCTTLYPQNKRVRVSAAGANFNNVSDGEKDARQRRSSELIRKRFTVVLDKIEHVPGMMALAQLIQPVQEQALSSDNESTSSTSKKPELDDSRLSISALRLIELSDRTSAVMKSSASEMLLHTDPLLSIFRMFGQLNDLTIDTSLTIVPYDDLAYSVAEHGRDADMIMVPWLPPIAASTHSPPDQPDQPLHTPVSPRPNNPFDILFKSQHGAGSTIPEKNASAIHSHFVRGVFAQSSADVALFVDQGGVSAQTSSLQHIFLPFFGGPDDRLAFEFTAQCCLNPRVSATIVRIVKQDDAPLTSPSPALAKGKDNEEVNQLTVGSNVQGFPDTVYGAHTTETRMQSETADNITWARYTAPKPDDPLSISASALNRMSFSEIASPTPLHSAISEAHVADSKSARKLVIIGRSRRMAVENHAKELKDLLSEKGRESIAGELKKTIGDVGTAFVAAGSASGIVVVQAAAGI